MLPGHVHPATSMSCDVRNARQVADLVTAVRPDAVLNCAAMTHVDQAEDDSERAFAVNTQGALNVARACAAADALAVYISTDYVFGGAATPLFAYSESDATAPLNVYGISKLAGEQATQAFAPRSLIVRSASLYGHAGARGKGGNFVETMLRLAGQGAPIRVVHDQVMTPTSTRACARRIVQLLEGRATGVYHVAAADSCSWYEFAREVLAWTGKPFELHPIKSSEYPMKARRPAYSALRSERLGALHLDDCGGWREMLYEYLETRPHTKNVVAA